MKAIKVFIISTMMLIDIFAYGQLQIEGRPKSFGQLDFQSKLDNVNIVEMPEFDIQAEIESNTRKLPMVFAKSFLVNMDIKTNGTPEQIENGTIWRIGIKSKNAYSINLIFKEFILNEGASLFIYNHDTSKIIGAFNSKNNTKGEIKSLACMPINGDLIYVELFEPAGKKSKCTLGSVNHDYLGVFSINKTTGFGGSGSCNRDILCPEGIPWFDEKSSVCKLIIDGRFLCTGAVINNTNEDGRPLFLTANHCYDNPGIEDIQAAANNTLFIFNYESPSCSGPNGSEIQNLSGSTLKARWNISDFLLLEINQDIPTPYYSYWTGWDRNITNPVQSVCIHHPMGDVKKISMENYPTTINAWPTGANCTIDIGSNFWKVNDWDVGTTEGGSSGSPLFNPNQRIIGQLKGGCALCGNNFPDYFGRIPISWAGNSTPNTRLSNWLDPLSIGPLEKIGLRYIRNYTVNHDAWYTGEVVKFLNVNILTNFNINVTSMQDRFEAAGTLDIPAGATFNVF